MVWGVSVHSFGFKHLSVVRTPGKRATEPCPCGFAGDREQECRCTPDQIRRYQMKVSGPLLDRVDLIVSVNRDGLRRAGGERPQLDADRGLARSGAGGGGSMGI